MLESNPSIEIIAPSVEEAIARGEAELDAPRDQLEIEILDEGTRGVLGVGSRQARVRLTLRGRTGEQDAPRGQPIRATQAAEDQPRDDPRSMPEDLDEDAETLKITLETVQDLIKKMGVEARVTVDWGERDAPGKVRPLLVDVRGDDLSLLIGRGGETLEALQYVTRLIVGKELHKPVSVVIDIEGYRARREEVLRKLARRMADQAMERGRTLSLEPMPPNERRIIHIELREHPDVRTESVGEGKRRKVTIIPER